MNGPFFVTRRNVAGVAMGHTKPEHMRVSALFVIIGFALLTACRPRDPSRLAVELMLDEQSNVILQITRGALETQELRLSTLPPEQPLQAISATVLTVEDLDADLDPEIILVVTTPGTNCCTSTVAVTFDHGSQQYQSSDRITRKWSLAPRMIDVGQDGTVEFLTRDEEYHHEVAGATATSALSPIQIFHYVEGHFVDVTREYPDLVGQDAVLWLATARGQVATLESDYLDLMREDPDYWATVERVERLAVAAYLADMYLLGMGDKGWELVSKSYPEWTERFRAALKEHEYLE